MLAIIAILIATIAAVVKVTQFNWTASNNILYEQVLQGASQDVRNHVINLLETGEAEGQQIASQVSVLSPRDSFQILAPQLKALVESRPDLTYVSVGYEVDGLYFHAHRNDEDQIEVQRSSPAGEKFVIDQWIGEKQQIKNRASDYDPRKRPYYLGAKSTMRTAWSDTYSFLEMLDGKQVESGLGVSCAVPAKKNGTLIGVVSIDFSLKALSSYLPRIQIGENGFAALIEARRDGKISVLAGADDVKRKAEIVSAVNQWSPNIPVATQHFRIGDEEFVTAISSVRPENPNWIIAAFIPRAELIGPIQESIRHTLGFISIGLLLAIVASALLAAIVSRPIRKIAERADRIRSLDLDADSEDTSRIKEIKQLQFSFDRLESSLASFAQFVPKDVVRRLLATGKRAEPLGVRKFITVMFVDVEGFTSIAENIDPSEAVQKLTRFFEVVTAAVDGTGGIIDKYIGDEVMALWGADVDDPEQGARACRAALQIQQSMSDLDDLKIRIGVHSGEAVVGIIGTSARLNFTAIGDTVNLAKRVEGQNKAFGTQILVSGETAGLVGEAFDLIFRGQAKVAGRHSPVDVFALLGPKSVR